MSRGAILIIVLLVLLELLVAALLVAVAADKKRKTSSTTHHDALLEGGGLTSLSFWTGVVFSTTMGLLLWWAIYALTSKLHDYPVVVAYMRHATGVMVGAVAGYSLFEAGRFNIDPGEKAYVKFMGIPWKFTFGPGWGWFLPWLMNYEKTTSAGYQDRSTQAEEALTGDGLEMFVESEATVSVRNPLLAKGIQGQSVAAYIAAQRLAAVRKYVARLRTKVLDLMVKPTPTHEERTEIFREMLRIKGDVSSNGPNEIQKLMNIEIQKFGLYVEQFEIESVLFNDRLEDAAQRVYEEVAEGEGLVADANNKALVIKVFNEKTLADIGLSLTDLSTEDKLDLLRSGRAFSLAAEGQGGSVNYHAIGGRNSGVMVGLSSGNNNPPKGRKPRRNEPAHNTTGEERP